MKDYQDQLDQIELTVSDDIEEGDALQSLEAVTDEDERFPYLETLTQILHHSAGITKTLTRRGNSIDFRAASCTGALYHIELYVISARLPGLPAGVYHYDPESSSLHILRKGDHRQRLLDATGKNYRIEDAPVILAYTSNFWRNAYKYKARAYRHAFWDSGTIISQTLAMASMLQLSSSVLAGFIDSEVSALLGLESDKELPLALVPLGYTAYSGLQEPPALDQKVFKSKEQELERQYPAILDMHRASSLTTVEQVQAWREQELGLSLPEKTDPVQLRPLSTRKMETLPLEQVIKKRGSVRKFSHEPLDGEKFANLMKMGTQPFPADFYDEYGKIYNRIYVNIHNVDDIKMGSYRFYPEDNQLEIIKYGYQRYASKEMGLNQDLANDAAVVVFFIADLDALMEKFGNRAYRVAQLEAAILGGKMYLAAEAQGFGATGLTFEDDRVTTFFDEEDKIATFMVCLGHRA